MRAVRCIFSTSKSTHPGSRALRRRDASFWWLVCIRRAAARCSRSAPRSPPSRPGAVARATAPCRTGPRTRRSASRRSIWWPCAPAGRACMARLPAPRPAWRRALRIPACHSPLFASGVNLGTRMPLSVHFTLTAAQATGVRRYKLVLKDKTRPCITQNGSPGPPEHPGTHTRAQNDLAGPGSGARYAVVGHPEVGFWPFRSKVPLNLN